jgi:hypothetical protein
VGSRLPEQRQQLLDKWQISEVVADTGIALTRLGAFTDDKSTSDGALFARATWPA